MNLNGKVSFVTGGARGIGRAISICLAREGSDVVVNYHRHSGNAEEVVEEIENLGRKAISVKGDVASSQDVASMVQEIQRNWEGVDVLVNNAGHMEGGPLLKTSEEAWQRLMDTHLRGAFLCSRKVAPYMMEKGAGKIINIGSTAGFSGGGNLPYCTAKGALITFTKSLARDLSKYNINVNCAAPGPTVTDLGAREPDPERRKKKRQKGKQNPDIPLGRNAEPEDIADAVLFFASNDYVTGETLYVSGGMQTLYHKLMM